MAIVSKNDEIAEELWASRIGSAPLFITLLLPLIIGVLVIAKCIFNHCCIRKSTTKEELFGVEGRMTILRNTEAELSNNNSAAASTNAISTNNNNSRPSSSISLTTGSGIYYPKKQANLQSSAKPTGLGADTVDGPNIILAETVDLNDSLRATVKRQLPDPPQSPPHAPRRTSSILSQDGTSDLYATVEEVPGMNAAGTSNDKREHLYSKVVKPKNGKLKASRSNDGPSSSKDPHPSSDSETYANSITNPHHPYAKLKRPNTIEHPYARVGVGSNRIRTESTGTAGEEAEETDTDNYDVTHPYAQINSRNAVAKNNGRGNSEPGTSRSSENNGNTSNDNNNSASNSANSTNQQHRNTEEHNASDENAPVPPRRVGRQWRRSSHPQGQPNNANDATENPALFSGDSQDSRGYSHLSVREPLSTIKAQTRKSSDPNYAFVSDDSEEMYAAIDDPVDMNYMSIDRPSRLGGPTSIVSPIPERREANSPLPPPPILSPQAKPTESPLGSSSTIPDPEPAIYAQVIKRKKKAPTSPSREVKAQTSIQNDDEIPSTSTSTLSKKSHPEASNAYAVSSESEPRRWSKADISYSEFEIIRESIYPVGAGPTTQSIPTKLKQKGSAKLSTSASKVAKYNSIEVPVDEDNYNIIPEPRSSHSRRNNEPHSFNRTRYPSEDMYQEIDEFSLDNNKSNHPYHEIPHRSSSTSTSNNDHYSEIGSNRRRKRNKSNEKKTENHSGNNYQRNSTKNTEGEDSDDEDEDDFYEKLKAKPRNVENKVKQESTSTNLGKKHGYEKLKRKPNENDGASAGIMMIGSDDDEDETGFYESVRYPNYAKVQKPQEEKSVNSLQAEKNHTSLNAEPVNCARQMSVSQKDEDQVFGQDDRDQLYARIDKTKKKRKEQDLESDTSKTDQAPSFEPTPTSTVHSPKAVGPNSISRSTGQLLTKDVTIEYI